MKKLFFSLEQHPHSRQKQKRPKSGHKKERRQTHTTNNNNNNNNITTITNKKNASLNRPRSRERGYHRKRVGCDTTMRSDLFGKLHVRVVLLRGDAGKVLRAGNHRVRPGVRGIRPGSMGCSNARKKKTWHFSSSGTVLQRRRTRISLASARKKCQSEDVLQRVDHERVRGIWFAIV